MSKPKWPAWAMDDAARLQAIWERNDEDLGSLTVQHNIAAALNRAKLDGELIGKVTGAVQMTKKLLKRAEEAKREIQP